MKHRDLFTSATLPIMLTRSIVPQILFYFILNCSLSSLAQLLIVLAANVFYCSKNSNPSPKAKSYQRNRYFKMCYQYKKQFPKPILKIFLARVLSVVWMWFSQVSAFKEFTFKLIFTSDIFAKIAISLLWKYRKCWTKGKSWNSNCIFFP